MGDRPLQYWPYCMSHIVWLGTGFSPGLEFQVGAQWQLVVGALWWSQKCVCDNGYESDATKDCI